MRRCCASGLDGPIRLPGAAQRTPRCGPGARLLGDVPGPGSRGGGTPAATGRGYVLAAARRTSLRGWEAHKGRAQADQAAGVAARLLPAAAFALPTWPATK